MDGMAGITAELKALNLEIAREKLEKQKEVKPADAMQQEAGKTS